MPAFSKNPESIRASQQDQASVHRPGSRALSSAQSRRQGEIDQINEEGVPAFNAPIGGSRNDPAGNAPEQFNE